MTWIRTLAARPWIRPAALATAVGLVALASVLPVWVARLFAPQYPRGLRLTAYGTRIEGDVREINGLNHYIGMQPLAADSIPELALWPLAIVSAIALAVVATLVRGWIGRLAMLGMWSIPLTVLADIQRWLYTFGHALDPDAALRVQPFTPLVVGPTSVWNFRIWAWPGGAVVLLLVAAAIVTVARRLPPAPLLPRRAAVMAAAVLVLGVFASALPAAAAAGPRAPALPSLQALVDAAPAGAEIVVPAGAYRGPVVIDRALTLRGAGEVVVDGGGVGTVITVRAAGTVIDGLRVMGSGGQVEDGAAISVLANGITIARTTITDFYSAVVVRGARDVRLIALTIEGRGTADGGIAAAHSASAGQGDGISIWDSTGVLVQGVRIDRVRDGVYLSYASDVLIDRSLITRSRYAVHAMFGSDLMLFENELRANASGAVLMYTEHATLARNAIRSHRSVATGYGILLKDVRSARVIENEIALNGVGVKVDGVEGDGSELLRNVIAYGGVGVEISPRSAVTVSANSFAGNAVQVMGGASATWTRHGAGNNWSDAAGFDLNGDGRSDVPHTVATGGDRLLAATPELRALRGSLAYGLMERAERWWSAGQRRAIDRSPLVRPLEPPVPPADRGGAPAPFALAGLGMIGVVAVGVFRR